VSDFSTAADARVAAAVGVTVQAFDSDLSTLAGLTPTTDNFIQSKAGAWASRTVAQVKTDLGLTGTNSGDQTSIVGITGTKAQFDTAVTDGNVVYVGDTISADLLTDGTTNKAFLATERTKLAGIATGATANSSDATLLARANHTGTQAASTISDFSTAADARVAAAVGVTVQGLDTDLTTIAGLTATTDSFMQAKAGAWASRTVAQVKTDLGLTGTNSGDQTSIVGITGTKAQFDTAITDGDVVYVGDTATAASGIASATTVVVTSGATAPTNGQVLTATSSTTATWQAAGAGSTVWTTTEIDFGSTPSYGGTFTIADGSVTAGSDIAVTPSGKVATGRVGNDWEWDVVMLSALPASGSFDVTASSISGPLVGKRMIQYQVG
jgi:hypothetical protein